MHEHCIIIGSTVHVQLEIDNSKIPWEATEYNLDTLCIRQKFFLDIDTWCWKRAKYGALDMNTLVVHTMQLNTYQGWRKMISFGGGWDDFIWGVEGGTEEIVDRPRGCKASAGGGCAPSRVKRGSKKLFVPNTPYKYKATLCFLEQYVKLSRPCYFCNTTGMHNRH